MKDGRMRVVVGIILVVLQAISIFGLLTGGTELWDTEYTMADTASVSVGMKQWLFGFEVGSVKLEAGLEEARESFVDTDGYHYRATTVEEFISANYRRALKNGSGIDQIFLFLFDLNILIGFSMYGIVGALLIAFGGNAGARFRWEPLQLDDVQTQGAKGLGIAAVVLAAIFGVLRPLALELYYGSLLTITLPELLVPAGFVCLGLFFLRYYGKKGSVLFSAALCFVGGGAIASALSDAGSMILADADVYLVLDLLSVLLRGAYGGVYLYCAVWLYRGMPREAVKKWAITGLVLTVCDDVLLPLALAVAVDISALMLVRLTEPVFSLIVMLYICTVKALPAPEPVAAAPRVSAPGCCPMCGIPVGGRERCMKCGTVLPVIEISAPVQMITGSQPVAAEPESGPATEAAPPAPPAAENKRFCAACGTELPECSAFCHYCGAKVPPKPQICFCRICGTKVPVGSAFCHSCGTELSVE